MTQLYLQGILKLKTIGLLGGMSWESTELYYRLINEQIKMQLGGLHSAKIAMFSVDFQEIEVLQSAGKWDEAGEVLAKSAKQIERAGADFLLICTNTMHKVAPQVQAAIDIPLIHLADATAERIIAKGIKNIGVLGTNFTMEQDFYKGRLLDQYGLNVIVPNDADRQVVHRIIYEELCLGEIKESSRERYLSIMDKMVNDGAEAIIEGCTEITLLVQQKHTEILLFDTTAIHAEAAASYALS